MAPRPVAKSDKTALRLLAAAASLIDEHVNIGDRRDRLPLVLMWLTESRISRKAGVGRGALRRRWHTMDDFARDAAMFALTYSDRDPAGHSSVEATPARHSATLASVAPVTSSPVELAATFTDQVLKELVTDPRSYLLAHLVPLLADATSAAELADAINADQRAWEEAFQVLLDSTGVVLRPGWTPHSVTLGLQAVLDGFVLRTRVQPADYPFGDGHSWQGNSLFADMILAFLFAVLDLDESGRTVYTELAQRWKPKSTGQN